MTYLGACIPTRCTVDPTSPAESDRCGTCLVRKKGRGGKRGHERGYHERRLHKEGS